MVTPSKASGWSLIGTVLQASQVEGVPEGTPSEWFLEAKSRLVGPEDTVHPWPRLRVPPAALEQARTARVERVGDQNGIVDGSERDAVTGERDDGRLGLGHDLENL